LFGSAPDLGNHLVRAISAVEAKMGDMLRLHNQQERISAMREMHMYY